MRTNFLTFLMQSGLLFLLLSAASTVFAVDSHLSSGDGYEISDRVPSGSVKGGSGGSTEEDASPQASDILGGEKGIIHPYFAFGTHYTDNFYNDKYYKKDEVTYVISPGVWMAYPGNHEQLLDVQTNPASTAGLSYDRDISENFRRFQTYLNYRADIEQNYHYSGENLTNHLAEGMLKFRLRGGLSFELMNQYVKNHNTRSSSAIGQLDKYGANLATFDAIYKFNRKFRAQLGYRNYTLDYEADRNRSMNRMDNAGTAYIFFKFMPKTAVFFQYEYANANFFDENVIPDSNQHDIYTGFDWKISSKSKGRVKLGYGHKSFTGDYNSLDVFNFELDARHQISAKTAVTARVFNGFNESMINTSRAIRANDVFLKLDYKLTGKISMNIRGSYHRDDFDGKFTYNNETKDRDDNYYGSGIEFKYSMFKWLDIAAGYRFLQRDSNFSAFDYTNNSCYLTILFYL